MRRLKALTMTTEVRTKGDSAAVWADAFATQEELNARHECILSHERASLFRALSTLTERGLSLSGLRPSRLAWAVADVITRTLNRKKESQDDEIDVRVTECWRKLKLAELGASVACEQRDDWQDPPSRPVDTSEARANFERIYRDAHPSVVRFARSRIKGAAPEAEDVAMTAWAHAFLRYWSPDASQRFAGRARITTLICQLVAFNLLKPAKPSCSLDAARDLIGLDAPVDQAGNQEDQRQLVLEAVQDLPPKQRIVARLLMRGHRQADIARMCGCTRAAINQRTQAMRKDLMRRLGGAID